MHRTPYAFVQAHQAFYFPQIHLPGHASSQTVAYIVLVHDYKSKLSLSTHLWFELVTTVKICLFD